MAGLPRREGRLRRSKWTIAFARARVTATFSHRKLPVPMPEITTKPRTKVKPKTERPKLYKVILRQ